jgi:hypothetical protein
MVIAGHAPLRQACRCRCPNPRFGAGRRPKMKQQIVRFSLHQNGKVFAVLMAVSSLIFLVPFGLFALAVAPSQSRPPMFMFLLMPLFYLVFGYLSVVVGCAIYNALVKVVGGIEFEASAGEGG